MRYLKLFKEWLGNKKIKLRLGEENYKEVRELVRDLRQNLGYRDIKLDIKNRNNAVVKGRERSSNIEVDMNFLTREMVQKESGKSYIFLPFLPHQETNTVIRGTLDGDIKRIKGINLRKDDAGNFREVTEITNKVSGNTYRRIKTPQGNTYEKLVNGNYVNLFNI